MHAVPALKRLKEWFAVPSLLLLGGCGSDVLDPAGDIALHQRDLLLQSTWLMLLIIVPVMALTIFFAWRYRAANTAARYEPDWDHSTQLELIIWGAPLLIIICLGALTWMGTHLLDPYRPLARSHDRQVQNAQPLLVEVVALDWKWLFIYPQYGVATVNQLAVPVGRPISFHITASSVMNSFYVPSLAGQIYAMPAMQTDLHAILARPVTSQGFSANYSGAGFSGMHFAFQGLAQKDFESWLAHARAGGGNLDRAAYLALERPSENVPPRSYAKVEQGLFDAIRNLCVTPGKMCMNQMAALDAKGGMGLAGITNLVPLDYDKYARRGTALGDAPVAVARLCAPSAAAKPWAELQPRFDTAPLRGAGLARPSSRTARHWWRWLAQAGTTGPHA
jgi:cytochrome o ubiquinol oxidase subunit 2